MSDSERYDYIPIEVKKELRLLTQKYLNCSGPTDLTYNHYTYRSFFLRLTSLLGKEKPVLAQVGGECLLTYFIDSLSIFSSCVYVPTDPSQRIPTELHDLYLSSIKEETKVTQVTIENLTACDVYLIFDQEFYSNQLINPNIIVLFSDRVTPDPSIWLKCFKGISLKITNSESIELHYPKFLLYCKFGQAKEAVIKLLEIEIAFKNNILNSRNEIKILESFKKYLKENIKKNLGKENINDSNLIDQLHLFFIESIRLNVCSQNTNLLFAYYVLKKVSKFFSSLAGPKIENCPIKRIFESYCLAWIFMSLIYNIDIAVLLVTGFIEYCLSIRNFVFDFLDYLDEIKRLYLTTEIIDLLRISYRNIIKKACREYYKLDSNRELESINESLIEEELESINKLIPEYILTFSNEIKLYGKTLLGGVISIKESRTNTVDGIKLSNFIFILRHELSHKKLLMNGSKNKYTLNSPEEKEKHGMYSESGIFIDNTIYGPRPFPNFPDLSKIDPNMAWRIINGEKLEEYQLIKMYAPNKLILTKKSFEDLEEELFCDARGRY